MKKIVNSNHYYALAVSGMILVGSVLAFIYMYYQVGVQTIATSVAYNQVASAQAQNSQDHVVINTLSVTKEQRDLLKTFFVPDNQAVSFITQIESIGSKSGGSTVSIASISDDDLTSASVGTTGYIHAHINIQGSWTSAMRALHLVESLPYGESIDNVRIAPISEKLWGVAFDLTADLIHAQ